MVREGRVFIAGTGSKPDFGSSYSVQALEVGAQVASGSSGTTITVRAGHGFAAGDKYMKSLDASTYSGTNTVQSVTATTVVVQAAYSVSAGDLLINLGPDTGTASPNYDGNGVTVYTDMDYTTSATNATVTCDSNGRYRYYHNGTSRWELVRTGSSLIALYTDTGQPDVSINVLDFGATGDGVTDDSAAIQAALTAVPSSGGFVYLPAGIYLVSNSPFIKSNTHVMGDGPGVTIIRKKANSLYAAGTVNQTYNPVLSCGPSPTNYFSKASPGYDITVSNLTIDGNEANHTHSGSQHFAYGFVTTANWTTGLDGCVDGLALRGVQVINSMETGVRINSCRNVVIDSCQVDTCGQDDSGAFALNGIDLYSNPTDYAAGWGTRLIVTGCRIRNISPSGSSQSGEGIATKDVGDVTISGNDIGYCDYGIEGNGTVFGNHTITGNTIHDLSGRGNGGVGITIVPSTVPTTTATIVVSGNTFHDIGGNAINIGYCGQVSVTGNCIYKSNGSVVTNNNFAIDLYQCTYGSATGNTVVFSSPSTSIRGIRAFLTGSGVVSGNTVYGPTAECVTINGGSSNVLVTGNRLIGGTYGVTIGSTGTNASNIIFNNSFSGQSSGETSDSSGQTNYIDNLNNLTVRGTLAATGTFKVGAGTDASVDITFDQGTGTDPVIRWYDTGDNFRFVTASATMDVPNRAGQLVPRVATVDATAQSANIGSASSYTVPTSGRYRVSGYVVVTQAATTSSTLPKIRLGWQDADSNVSISPIDLTATNTGNTVGTTYSSGSIVISARATNTIAYDTTGYATSGATSMQYAMHLVVEAL